MAATEDQRLENPLEAGPGTPQQIVERFPEFGVIQSCHGETVQSNRPLG